ncbi:MAG: type II secretion system protein GspG [Deltaproteobacteria bacterium]|nr:type II secretion system protein GspG [Deltaproteobacteria bacterium]
MHVHRDNLGFTLLELLIVIAIIGIFSAAAVVSYKAFMEKARKIQALAQLKKIHLAIEDLAIDTGMWPGPNPVGETAHKEVWDLTKKKAGLVKADKKFENWNGPYIDAIPLDPWGSKYFFDPDYHIDGKEYAVIGSFGPNRKGKNKYDSDDVVLILPAT